MTLYFYQPLVSKGRLHVVETVYFTTGEFEREWSGIGQRLLTGFTLQGMSGNLYSSKKKKMEGELTGLLKTLLFSCNQLIDPSRITNHF